MVARGTQTPGLVAINTRTTSELLSGLKAGRKQASLLPATGFAASGPGHVVLVFGTGSGVPGDNGLKPPTGPSTDPRPSALGLSVQYPQEELTKEGTLAPLPGDVVETGRGQAEVHSARGAQPGLQRAHSENAGHRHSAQEGPAEGGPGRLFSEEATCTR